MIGNSELLNPLNWSLPRSICTQHDS